jgi:hypothetical protein
MCQQRGDVLAHVMTARAIAKIFGALVVVLQRQGGYFVQVVRVELHARITTSEALHGVMEVKDESTTVLAKSSGYTSSPV